MDRSKVGIIIPAYNEEDTILDVIKKCQKYGKVIIIDDGSDDNTINLLRDQKVVLIKHIKNLGYDEALNSGFLKEL